MSSLAPSSPARPSRRAVASALAWSVPVVAVGAAAPRAAASPCPPQAYTLDWSQSTGTVYTRSSSQSGTAVVDPDGAGPVAPVTLSISSTLTGAMSTGNESGTQNQNLRVSPTTVGGTSSRGLQLEQTVTGSRSSAPGRSARQTVTFTFSEPIRDLRFTMTDIDATQGDFIDMVELSPGFTSAYDDRYLRGNGTQASPLRPVYWGDRPTSSNLGNATITYAGPLTSFTIVYWNAESQFSNADRNQIVTFTNFDFQVVRNSC